MTQFYNPSVDDESKKPPVPASASWFLRVIDFPISARCLPPPGPPQQTPRIIYSGCHHHPSHISHPPPPSLAMIDTLLLRNTQDTLHSEAWSPLLLWDLLMFQDRRDNVIQSSAITSTITEPFNPNPNPHAHCLLVNQSTNRFIFRTSPILQSAFMRAWRDFPGGGVAHSHRQH